MQHLAPVVWALGILRPEFKASLDNILKPQSQNSKRQTPGLILGFVFVVLGIKLRSLHLPGTQSTTEPHPGTKGCVGEKVPPCCGCCGTAQLNSCSCWSLHLPNGSSTVSIPQTVFLARGEQVMMSHSTHPRSLWVSPCKEPTPWGTH